MGLSERPQEERTAFQKAPEWGEQGLLFGEAWGLRTGIAGEETKVRRRQRLGEGLAFQLRVGGPSSEPGCGWLDRADI